MGINCSSLTFIMRVSDACNLQCEYCYANAFIGKHKGKKLLINVTEKLVDDITNLKLSPNEITIILHGGEPLLVGLKTLSAIIEIVEKLRSFMTVNLLLQTNGLLLNKFWVDFLKEKKITVGISLDGPRDVHNLFRKSKNNEDSFSKVFNSIKLLKTHYRSPDILTVISKANVFKAKELLNFFLDNDITALDFLPAINNNNTNDPTPSFLPYISVSEYAKFLKEIFDVWYTIDNPDIEIRILQDIMQGLIGGNPRLCIFRQCCHKYLTINMDGNLYGCSRLSHLSRFKLGNILSSSLNEIMDSEIYQKYKSIVLNIPNECKECKLWSICKGGCLSYRFTKNCSTIEPNLFCLAYKEIFQYVAKSMHTTAKQLDLAEISGWISAYL